MKKETRYCMTCLVLFFLAFSFVCKAQIVSIYYTNDTHSQLEPYVYDGKSYGGIARRATLIKKKRAEEPELLLFDSGDLVQGTPYFTFFKGKAEITMMRSLGYDATILGNHEFDYGLEGIKKMIDWANCESIKGKKLPILCANYDFTGSILEGLIQKHQIFYKKGVKIGVFGLTVSLDGLTMKENYEGVDYLDFIEVAKQEVEALQKEKCAIIICLSHLGLDSDKLLAEQTRGIHYILGGHSHSLIKKPLLIKDLDGKEVAITQMMSKGTFLGHYTIQLKAKEEMDQ